MDGEGTWEQGGRGGGSARDPLPRIRFDERVRSGEKDVGKRRSCLHWMARNRGKVGESPAPTSNPHPGLRTGAGTPPASPAPLNPRGPSPPRCPSPAGTSTPPALPSFPAGAHSSARGRLGTPRPRSPSSPVSRSRGPGPGRGSEMEGVGGNGRRTGHVLKFLGLRAPPGG